MRRTKIVATLGPSSNTPDKIRRLIKAGLNVARLNFSHGTHESHAHHIALVRRIARELGQPVAILQDLQGPKIRTGELTNNQPVELAAGEQFILTTDECLGTARRVSTTYEYLPADVRAGDRILLSDGLIELRVLTTNGNDVITEVTHGGMLREHQGINLPGVRVSAPAVTPKDLEDLEFGLQHDVDYVAISFVRAADDVRLIKHHIAQAGKPIPVVAKIERPEALEVLPEILEVADVLMVARGDLGVEMPPEDVPLVQKQIIEAANRSGVPVITATQMLESMIQNPRPTRAEASDVANAIIDGTDAVMLSGETAAGSYPVEAVQMMALIAETIETSGRRGDMNAQPRWSLPEEHSIPRAISAAACRIAETLPIRCIVVFTRSGSTARNVSHYRPLAPILAFSPSERVYRQMALLWGVLPFQVLERQQMDELEHDLQSMLIRGGYAAIGEPIVMTGGHPIYRQGPTNYLKILEVTDRHEPADPVSPYQDASFLT